MSVTNLDGGSSAANPPRPVPGDKRLFFLDAPGGTGKTFFTNCLRDFAVSRGKKVLMVATSAVAAGLMNKGTTAHSALKIPIPCYEDSTCHFSPESALGKKLMEYDVIVWDEVVMAHRHAIEAAERSLRDLMNNAFPFGGKVVVLSGDFRQILPVIPGGSRPQIVNACFKSSGLYSKCQMMQLTENMRLRALLQDPNASPESLQYPNFLLQVGEGRYPREEDGRIKLPDYLHVYDSLKALCDAMFPPITTNYRNTA